MLLTDAGTVAVCMRMNYVNVCVSSVQYQNGNEFQRYASLMQNSSLIKK